MRHVYVISDLHLGGPEGRQMCSPAGRALLVDFLQGLTKKARAGQDIHLVVNGDAVDFLAEPPFEAFTGNNQDATRKLAAIFESTRPVWDAFREVVAAGAPLTVLLGNHDLELSLPGPRTLLRDTLGPGRVDLLFDNQALDLGEALIEHGNRYDAWNIVDHDGLRAWRSRASRRETQKTAFKCPAGSRLVADVMNSIKDRLGFVDLLKPENDAVIPLIVALARLTRRQLEDVIQYYRVMKTIRFDPSGRPMDERNIAAAATAGPKGPGVLLAEQMIDDAIAGDAANIASGPVDLMKIWWNAGDPAKRQRLIAGLYQAFRHRLGEHCHAFTVNQELPEYVTAAESSTTSGFKFVVYGHTHLAKRCELAGGWGTYLNSGTWADLMMVPPAVLSEDEVSAKQQLELFVTDIEHNRLSRWRRPLPTFVRIEMEEAEVRKADVYVFKGSGMEEPVPAGVLEPLALPEIFEEGV